MNYNIRPLALNPDQLNGLSSRLITSHHENNYTGAIKRLNAIRGELAALDWGQAATFTINGLKREELIAANSAFLHELYFDNLGGDGVLPSCGLSVALERDFGSVERWRQEFTGLAKAMGGGSGWALLSWSSRESRLVIHWAADHTHLMAGATPVLALDMYEHAYHMDFGAKAGAYVDAFMANIQWDKVYRRYGAAVEADALALGVDTAAVLALGQGAIDVRRQEDYLQSAQMVAGASWRDPSRVKDWSQELDPSKPVLLYCLRGKDIGRSTVLSLRARGFDARYLNGGIEAWEAAGLPLQARGGSV
ncbi:Fe-Mn family superoxide dismutase [Acidovorax sp.]|jgi:Fe-Mn family superoxide dismutase|uniref:Fe-Mn family superoxide dismutase n=1 Tax=Acidovorax sp. TaxID=1872122 RepID=UPI00391F2ADA